MWAKLALMRIGRAHGGGATLSSIAEAPLLVTMSRLGAMQSCGMADAGDVIARRCLDKWRTSIDITGTDNGSDRTRRAFSAAF